MKHILIPTDFSEPADNAINFAVNSNKYFAESITLLHSLEVGGNMYVDYMGVNKEFNSKMIGEAEARLRNVKQDLAVQYGVAVDTVVSTTGLKEAIDEAVQSLGVDLVVMGTLGASGSLQRIWGSRTSSVIGNTKVPVMAIPVDYTWKKPGKILFTTNFFEKEKAVLDFIFELAELYMAEVQVAVFTNQIDDSAAKFIRHSESLEAYQSFLKTEYREDTLSGAHLYGDDFEETIQKYIEEHEIDILVMVTYQDNIWARFFNPSKTRAMSYQTRVPLLAIPADFGKK